MDIDAERHDKSRIGGTAFFGENPRPAKMILDTGILRVAGHVSREGHWGWDGASLECVPGIAQDPMGLRPDSNPYRYCGNGPTDGMDPSGLVIVAYRSAHLGEALDAYHVRYHSKDAPWSRLFCVFWNDNDGANLLDTNPYGDGEMDQQILFGMLAGNPDGLSNRNGRITSSREARVFFDGVPFRKGAAEMLAKQLHEREAIVNLAKHSPFAYRWRRRIPIRSCPPPLTRFLGTPGAIPIR